MVEFVPAGLVMCRVLVWVWSRFELFRFIVFPLHSVSRRCQLGLEVFMLTLTDTGYGGFESTSLTV